MKSSIIALGIIVSSQDNPFPFVYRHSAVDVDGDSLADVPAATGIGYIMNYTNSIGDGSFVGKVVNYSK